MEKAFIHRLHSQLWRLVVGAVVLLAVYAGAGRVLMANVSRFEQQILAELNARVPFALEARTVRGEWRGFTPELVLEGLNLYAGGSLPLQLREGRVALDVWASLVNQQPRIQKISLSKLRLRARITDDGKFEVPGFQAGDGGLNQYVIDFLLGTRRVELIDNEFYLELPDGSVRELRLDAGLDREGSTRHLRAALLARDTGARIDLIGSGVGNPMKPDQFRGNVWLDVAITDLAVTRRMARQQIPDGLAGALNVRLWLDWDRGEADLTGEAHGQSLALPLSGDVGQALALDEVSARFTLDRKGERWLLDADRVTGSVAGATAALSQLQVALQERTLELRIAELPVGDWVETSLQAGLVQGKLFDVLQLLEPRGNLQTLRLTVGDYREFAREWQLTARLERLALESWKGAPGVRHGRGFVSLGPGGGHVTLDSDDLILHFPTVYEQPLPFDEVYGTLFIDWDSEAVQLNSGVLTTLSEEGRARGLFGLNIPLAPTETGLEMDLVIGLRNIDSRYRDRFIPYKLNADLRAWLSESLQSGQVDEGAFVWRGSLRPQAGPMRTVQLYFDVSDAALIYHPQWPPVTGVGGLILVDDTDVSVWAENASVYGSQVSYLSAEAWMEPGKGMMLDLAGTVSGDAGDALRVMNNSPLSALVNDAFVDWQASGPLQTQLSLSLEISRINEAPRVSLRSEFRDVDIDVRPSDLPLRNVEGQLAYDTDGGLSSRYLQGTLWSQPVTAQISEKPAPQLADWGIGLDEEPTSVASRNMVQVDLSTRVAMDDVRRWLDLDMLRLATGTADVDVQVLVPAGRTPAVFAQTDLVGVGLDLPNPWFKDPEDISQLSIGMPLGGERRVAALDLEQALFLSVALREGGYSGAALGLGRVPMTVPDGELRVSGFAPVLEQQALLAFVDTYLTSEAERQGLATQEESDWLPLHIEQLEVGQLRLFGEQVEQVTLSGTQLEDSWELSARADWLRGDMTLAADLSSADIRLEYLNLDGLSQLALESDVEADSGLGGPWPDLSVEVGALNSGEALLGSLSFTATEVDETLRFRDIRADLVGLRLGADSAARLDWSWAGGEDRSAFLGEFAFDDFGQVLDAMAYQRVVETRDGRFRLDLNWPGAPTQFALDRATGEISIQANDGRFLETSAAAEGTLRVLSIFNLAHFVNQLSLDMSDMFTSGIPFDTLRGEIGLDAGTVTVDPLDVRGRSSRFELRGVSDVASQSVEGEMVVTLPVANNLPWIAALAGGLPVAAGVFVVSKVFEDQMNTLSSAVYDLDGDWSSPELKFSRIFRSKRSKRNAEAVASTTESANPAADAALAKDDDVSPPESDATAEPDVPAISRDAPIEPVDEVRGADQASLKSRK